MSAVDDADMEGNGAGDGIRTRDVHRDFLETEMARLLDERIVLHLDRILGGRFGLRVVRLARGREGVPFELGIGRINAQLLRHGMMKQVGPQAVAAVVKSCEAYVPTRTGDTRNSPPVEKDMGQ